MPRRRRGQRRPLPCQLPARRPSGGAERPPAVHPVAVPDAWRLSRGPQPGRAADGLFSRLFDSQNPGTATYRGVDVARPQWGRSLRENRARSWVTHVMIYGFGTGEVSGFFRSFFRPFFGPFFRPFLGSKTMIRRVISGPPDTLSAPAGHGGCKSSPSPAGASRFPRSRRTNSPL